MKKILLLTFIMCVLLGFPTYAAEKEYIVDVNKFYSSAKISITVPDDATYTVSAISPKGEYYEAVTVSERVMECLISSELETGEWVVKVVKTPLEGNEDTPVSDVEIVFEGLSESAIDIGEDIVIAADIVGLRMYFKDDNFVAEWTDTSCGNVNIEVVNEKTNQVIDKTTVQSTYYEVPIPVEAENIIVKLVPSVSSNKDGAQKQYIYKVENNPNATVVYEDIAITNKDIINVHITLNDSYSVMILNNGKEVLATEILEAGEYEYEVPTEIGDNNYLTYIIDSKHNMRSTAGYVEKDVIAPVLQLSQEYTQIETLDESIFLEGKVRDYDIFTINDKPVEVEGDHTFKYEYFLKEGMNEIRIVASDKAGNVSSYVATVIQIIPEEEPFPWDKLVIPSIIILLAILYIVGMAKKKNNGVYKKDKEKKKERVAAKKKPSSFNDKNKIFKELLDILIPVVVIYILFWHVWGVTVIESASMEPTLTTGNTVFLNRLAYKTGQEVKRGDIIVFESKEFGTQFGKRVIGLPGDIVEFKDGYVVINGIYADESAYLSEDIETNCNKTFTVPDGCYFMLGDNRENSLDSRYWANPYIDEDAIIGRYMGQIDFSIKYDILMKILG